MKKNNLINWLSYLQEAEKALKKKRIPNDVSLNTSPDQIDRITSSMPTDMIVHRLSENYSDGIHPGAFAICREIISHSYIFQPEDSRNVLLNFNELHIYSSQMWDLLKDCLDGSLLNLSIMFQMHKNGDLTEKDIQESIENHTKIETPLEYLDKYNIERPFYDYNIETKESTLVLQSNASKNASHESVMKNSEEIHNNMNFEL